MRWVFAFTAFIASLGIADGNAITSTGSPHIRVVVPQSARYVGRDRFLLFGIANCDLYAFLEADARRSVRRLYWVQFEGYIPSMPKLHHTYDSKRHAKIGGLDFYVDTWVESYADAIAAPKTEALKAAIHSFGYAVPRGLNSGSDEQHIYALIRKAGYAMPAATMSVRFVHLLDSSKRHEVMIIYSEPAQSTKLDDASAAALTERAERLIKIQV